MSEFLIRIILASFLGFLAGLGAGGGSLLILWLTLVEDIPPLDARKINLLFFLPSAIISTLLCRKKGNLSCRKLLPAIIGGCAAAGLCSLWGQNLELSRMRKLLGILFVITGCREFFHKTKT